MAEFAIILDNITRDLNEIRTTSLSDTWDLAQKTRASIEDLSKRMEPRVGYKLDGTVDYGNTPDAQLLLVPSKSSMPHLMHS